MRFLIKIDEEVLQNLAGFLEKGFSKDSFVKLVDSNWEPSSDPDHEKFEPIVGCTEKYVGWSRVGPHMIDAEFYASLSGYEHVWEDLHYLRPPKIVRH